MTCYLGPDNPPPLSLVSEIHQRLLQVSKVHKEDDKLFNFGEKYYSQLCKLLRMQSGINIDDKICVICSRKSRVVIELERRLCLINPIVKLSLCKVVYEELTGPRDMTVSVIPINAEDFFTNENCNIRFDKVIILDGLELVLNKDRFLENVKKTLTTRVDSSLVIVHRTKDMLTLPVYIEAINDYERRQIEVDELLTELIGQDFLIGWNIVSLPIHIPKDKWFNQLFNHFPPIMENVNSTDVYGGLRELTDTSFKYSEYMVNLKDRFLLLVANLSDNIHRPQPYKMFLLDDEIETTTDQLTSVVTTNILRLTITPDIRVLLPKNMAVLSSFLDDEDPYPEEWWGTMANIPMGGLDKSRINRYLPRRNKK